MKQTPKVYVGGLSNRVYVATKWKQLPNGAFEALEKFDITEDFERIARGFGLSADSHESERS